VQWSPSAWYADEEATLYAPDGNARTGNTCLKVQNLWMNDARYQQTVTVKENTVYKLSGWVRAEGITDGWGANLSVENTFAASEGVFDTDGEWVEETLFFETTDGQTQVTIFLRVGGYSGESQGTAWFDDLSLTEVSADQVPEGVTVESVAQAQDYIDSASDPEPEAAGVAFLWPMILISAAFVLLFWHYREAFLPKGDLLREEDPEELRIARIALTLALAAAALLRITLAPIVAGYPNDIGCWQGWSDRLAQVGFSGFYSDDMFCDYPPLYLYVLWIVGHLRTLLGIEFGSGLHMLLVKLPAIAADIVTSVLLFRLCRKQRMRLTAGLSVAVLYAFAPVVWFNSACFGQIDSILALCAALYLYFLYRDRILPASVVLVLGFLMKPQMALLAPALLVVFVRYWQEKGWVKACLVFIKSLGAGLLAGALAVLPFWGSQPWNWLAELYTGTMGQYPYGSVSAANFMVLIGGLWTPDTVKFLGITLKAWGIAGIVLSAALFFFVSFRKKDRDALFLHTALLLTGIFAFGCYMHERYIFPALLILLLGYCVTRRKNLLWYFVWFSVTTFANTSLVLANQYLPDGHWSSYLVSAMVVAGFGTMATDAVREALGMEPLPLPGLARSTSQESRTLCWLAWAGRKAQAPALPSGPVYLEKKDILPLTIVTALYAVLAFTYLGSLKTPETYWETTVSRESVVVDLGENHEAVSEIWSYRGLSYDQATMDVEVSPDGENWTYLKELYMMDQDRGGDVWRWFSDLIRIEPDMRYVRFSIQMPLYRFHEIFFRTADGQPVPIQSILTDIDREHGPKDAFDEQDRYFAYESFWNSTYFDEIYHPRTAWEMMEGESIYETTHPPLGKTLIGVGIRLFGLTPFGWRFMGTLIGVLMVPVMFLLAKALFRKSRYAWAATFLLTFDFMHFVQTRLATIDSYSVFFTMLMMYFMLRFLLLNYHKAPLKKIFLYLGLSGLFFGLGAASKWTCLYSGAGLAVLFFYAIAMRMREAAWAGKGLLPDVEAAEQDKIAKNFWKRTGIVLAWCVLVFLVIPGVIYCLSYIPYMKDGFDIQVVLDSQKSMYNYHANLVDDHFFKSPWYEWPFLVKPMWYYKNSALPAGQMGSIASFGNPLVWWTGTVAMFWLVFRAIQNGRRDERAWWILACFCSQYLPWVLVPRSMFIYHYFGSVPFFILATVFLFRELEKTYPKPMKWATVGFACAAVLLFIFFYPVLSGMPISSAYGSLLRWMPTWYFTY